MLVSPAYEAQMGLSAFSQIKKEEKVSTNPIYNDQVKRVGQRIAETVGREIPNAEWEFVVFESDDVNAFALPGGKVGVYTGLLKLAENDDELACVMGHEIGHVTSRHGAERISQNLAVAGIGVIGALSLDAADVDPAKRNAILAGYGLGTTVGVLLPYSRAHETEADSIGLRFAAGAGYDPRAAARFWRKMQAAHKDKARPPEILSTHPSDERRIANLDTLAREYMDLYLRSKAKYE
jgi:predicted Zn-dependent protease